MTYIDEITDYQYQNKKTSSSHFLAPFIHEWIHSFHLNYIYSKFGYGGTCDYLKEIYPNKTNTQSGYQLIQTLENKKLSPKENELIFDILGEYSTLPHNQYLEIFSETFTKFICASMKGTDLIRNPIDLLKSTPIEFQNILRKVCQFK